MAWDEQTYLLRINDPSKRCRHAAGSPTGPEIDAYAEGCDRIDPSGTVLILGMTPELRELAARRFARTIAIDRSDVAIRLFADWLPPELREKETIVRACWTEIARHVDAPLAGVLGDGALANLPDRAAVTGFLRMIRTCLAPDGVCVMRNVIVPDPLDAGRYRFDRILEGYRSGRLDAAEFGFTARFLGFHDVAFDPSSDILDNAVLYSRLDTLNEAGLLSRDEWEALSRYRFSGRNFFPTRTNWETLLAEAGFGKPTSHTPAGKLWYDYYPVESFQPSPLG